MSGSAGNGVGGNEMEAEYTYVVAMDGTGDFLTIREALQAAEEAGNEPAVIYIKKGIYSERLEITRPFLTLLGESAKETVITGGKLFSVLRFL